MEQIAEELRTGNSHNLPLEGVNVSEVAVIEKVPTVGRSGINPNHTSVYEFEEFLSTLPQVELPIAHHFCNGLYQRDMYIPAGTALTGAVHREDSFFIIRSGILRVLNGTGEELLGPGFMAPTFAGAKRAGYAVTDVICTTVHSNPNNETDPVKLWDSLTVPPDGLGEIAEKAYLSARAREGGKLLEDK